MRTIRLLIVAALLMSCEAGLSPPHVDAGFGGTITFEKGTWPDQDSLLNLWVFASKIYPLDSTKVFEGLFGNPPTIYLYPALDGSLPFYVDSVSYAFVLPPAEYRYVGIIQRLANEVNPRSLRVVGVYGMNDQSPLPVFVNEAQFVQGINISVNFHRLPPQPF